MRKIIAMIHMSLDGLTAGPNDELNWVSYDSELEAYAHAMHEITDAVIWGRRTYEGMAGYWLTVPGNPDSTQPERDHAAWLDSVTKIVVSRTIDRVEWGGNQNTLLIKDNIVEQINALKQQAGKDIWFLGSVNLMQTFMKEGLIDEYRLNINPTVLGNGKPLFAEGQNLSLTLLEARTLKSGVVALCYEPAKK